MTDTPRGWAIATDPREVHAVLLASDGYQGEVNASPVPRRDFAATEQYVEAGQVHALTVDGRLVGTFTLTDKAPFALEPGIFRAACSPMYLTRLAVAPDRIGVGDTVGVQCVRKALEAAHDAGADVLRSEANPDLWATMDLLRTLGFEQVGPVRQTEAVRRVAFERRLDETGTR